MICSEAMNRNTKIERKFETVFPENKDYETEFNNWKQVREYHRQEQAEIRSL